MAAVTRDITERSFTFAKRIVRLIHYLPRGIASEAIARQLIRSGTSVGANIEEAQAASSKKEFCRRMEVAQSEARETLYWLRLVSECGMVSKVQLANLLQESDELVRIVTAIARKSRGR